MPLLVWTVSLGAQFISGVDWTLFFFTLETGLIECCRVTFMVECWTTGWWWVVHHCYEVWLWPLLCVCSFPHTWHTVQHSGFMMTQHCLWFSERCFAMPPQPPASVDLERRTQTLNTHTHTQSVVVTPFTHSLAPVPPVPPQLRCQ